MPDSKQVETKLQIICRFMKKERKHYNFETHLDLKFTWYFKTENKLAMLT